jgi:ABC-type multidrug transport system fused ATPase/permease subunit
MQFINRFLYIIAGRRKALVFFMSLFLIISFLEVVGIGLMGPFIALATNPSLLFQFELTKWAYAQFGFDSEVKFIGFLGASLVGILYLKAIIGFWIQRQIFLFGFGQQSELRLRLLRAYFSAPYTFHLNRNTAVSIQNVVGETGKFANGVLMPILFSASNLIVILALVILLLKTDPVATISILLVLLIVAAFIYRFKDKLSRWGKIAREADIAMIRVINHSLGGLKDMRVIGCEAYFEKEMTTAAARFKGAVANANSFTLIPRYALESLLVTFLVGLTLSYLWFGGSQGLISTLVIFGTASTRLLPAASNLLQTLANLRYSTPVVDQLYFDLQEVEKASWSHISEVPQITPGAKLMSKSQTAPSKLKFTDRIEVEELTFRYAADADLTLNHINLQIQKGQAIGLIGRSGAGKSTLVDVILGLLTPESGDIKVDGVSVLNDLRAWQSLIGYIPQSIFLMDQTIARNIAFGVADEHIDLHRLNRAVEAAQLSELVDQLPDGLDTFVGERGIRLSGGQRQRIGIARALYHEREILILDEATSALDNETEALVSQAIQSLSGTKTMIIIAHRLSTIEHCDRIYLLEKGQVVKSGSYQEVVLGEQVYQ